MSTISMLHWTRHAACGRSYRDFVALLREWRRRQQSRRELAGLCERALRDIRLSRYDALREANKPFWRE
jgi:uncharacterized protein YjiS (DUF1127 family)